MHYHRWALPSLLILSTLNGFARAGGPPRLRASWKEKHAKIKAFSPDSRSLVSSGDEGYRLRDAETGEVRKILTTDSDDVNGLLFSPDGQLLFGTVRSEEHKPVIVLDLKAWEVATGRVYGTIPYIAESINGNTDHFALSPDGKMLATLDNSERLPTQVKTSQIKFGEIEVKGSYNASPGLPRIKLWSVPEWRETGKIEGGSHMVFSPDGTALATGSRDWNVPLTKVWDTTTWKLRAELDGKAPWVKPMTFSPNGKFLAISGREDETLWELASGKKWMVPAKNGGSRDPVFSPDSGLLFPSGLPRKDPAWNMNVEFPCYDVSSLPPSRLELGSGQYVVQPLTNKEPRLVISPAAMKYAVFGGADEQGERTLEIRGLPDRRVLAQSTVRGLIEEEFSADGRWLALMVGRIVGPPGGPDTHYRIEIRLLDTSNATMAAMVAPPGRTWGNYEWKFSPDGNSLAVSYRTGSNQFVEGEPDPGDRPVSVEIWEIQPR